MQHTNCIFAVSFFVVLSGCGLSQQVGNTSRIAFVSAQVGQDGFPECSDIYVMDADGDNPTNLTNNEAIDFISVWSP